MLFGLLELHLFVVEFRQRFAAFGNGLLRLDSLRAVERGEELFLGLIVIGLVKLALTGLVQFLPRCIANLGLRQRNRNQKYRAGQGQTTVEQIHNSPLN